jgi:K+-sensing histidine kinase KdpD
MAITLGIALVLGLLIGFALGRRGGKGSDLGKTKDQFVSLASHYLLTPISIIQGALSQLQENDSVLKVEERHKLYDSIDKGQQRLWILAEQMLLVNQVESNTLQLKLEAGSLIDIAQGAMTAVDIFAREKNIHLELKNETSTLSALRVDARRSKQAIMAIIDNAIKFSPEGSTVTVDVVQEAHSIAVDIIDMGPGMTEQAINTATQQFSRGTSSLTFDHEGIGLGLYTANAIIREHGCELRFDTSSKKGTTVTLRFPTQ